ncbi:helix-turn-helix domain-containing protein [Listeria booriae]|uniref:helix-turn-helix domain-containing protein n=1 Tax=Listeria booriae TaxID=1552123 RepID=UPI0016294D9F|nr:AraC family transcriptional regulator [Listeria booriae]MBC1234617.1 AraC family transcriptional regulator [Listeria booriae]MBC1245105.1 AraC family transcriptional regulator [Listeria booriae]
MLKINTTTFNPQILYIADCYTNEPSTGTKHHHDFLEMSIIYSGRVNYNIDNQIYHLKAGDVLLFNPGIDHFEFSEDGTENTQIHIGFRHFSLEGYPRDTFPFKTSVIRLHENKTKFMETCTQLLAEKYHEKPGYDLMLKALLMHLIIYILRDADPEQLENNGFKLSTEAQEKQTLVNEIIHYMEKHHTEDVTLSSLSQTMYISPTYISKVFKEETGESPINYLIKIRLSRAHDLLTSQDVTVKEAAKLVGYNDAFYFSKLFKKYYGFPPSDVLKQTS